MTSLNVNQLALCTAIKKSHEDVKKILHTVSLDVNFACPEDVDKIDHFYSISHYPHSYNRTTPICQAVKKGCLETVKLLYDAGAYLNYRFLPLVEAAREGDLKIIKFLISKGALLNRPDCNGNTALYYALLYDQSEAAQELIKCGANKDLCLLNACDQYKRPTTANADVIRWLVRNGAKINMNLNGGAILALPFDEDTEFNRQNFPGLRAILLQEEDWIPYLKARIKDLYESCCNPKKNKRKIA